MRDSLKQSVQTSVPSEQLATVICTTHGRRPLLLPPFARGGGGVAGTLRVGSQWV